MTILTMFYYAVILPMIYSLATVGAIALLKQHFDKVEGTIED